jgi:hypothetical protein
MAPVTMNGQPSKSSKMHSKVVSNLIHLLASQARAPRLVSCSVLGHVADLTFRSSSVLDQLVIRLQFTLPGQIYSPSCLKDSWQTGLLQEANSRRLPMVYNLPHNSSTYAHSPHSVENFPGFPSGILGPELMDKFREQSIRFGTTIITETVSKIDLSSRPFCYWRERQEDEEPETADAIIIATGASAKRLGLKGEGMYWQSGISACAVCDGAVPIFRNKPLAVIGGGDSAAEEATCERFPAFLKCNVRVVTSLVSRSNQICIACLCPRPSWRAACVENHGETYDEQPQDRAFLTPCSAPLRGLTKVLDNSLEHSRNRMSRRR